MKTNYQQVLLDLIKTLDYKPTLLLHSCCGPCSTEVINFLIPFFNITVFYYNPNIEPEAEYLKRKNEQLRFLNEFNKTSPNPVAFLDCDYENARFKEASKGLEQEKEGGARCSKCFYLRLNHTAEVAKHQNFEYFGTTLTVSPHKNSAIINTIGEKLASIHQIKYLYGDFKKNDGYKKSIAYSKLYNLYRQDYCGCLYGKEQNHA